MEELKKELEERYGEIHITYYEDYGKKTYLFRTKDEFVVAIMEVKK